MSSHILLDYSYLGPGGVLGATSVMLALAAVAVTLRFFTRYQQESRILADDFLVLAGLILFIGMCIAMIVGVKGGAVGHRTPLPPPSSHIPGFRYTSPEQQLTGKTETAVQWLQILSLGCIKASVLMFYRRIFCIGHPRNWFSILNTSLLGLVALWTVAFFFDFVFSCGTHFNAMWSTVLALEEYCKGSTKGQMAFAITDFMTDFFVICLPIPMVARLHASLRRKFAVIGVFMLGAVAVAASVVRMSIFIIVDVSGFNSAQDGDLTVTLFLFWSIIESGLAIIAACLPTLGFLFRGLKLATSSFLSTFRSALSRQRLHSQTSFQPSHRLPKSGNETIASSSRTHMTDTPRGNHSVEAFAMKDLDDVEALQRLPGNNILVHNSLSQRDNQG